mmetsp:Transcript_14405/g.26535  ORF Transcript_14405/g.26535 Transcript_14405/m.26535 type:complete len:363 (+) Transcript_14405:61-1149(+)
MLVLLLWATHLWLACGQGLMDDEKLLASTGQWHRGQRKRVSFGTACYFTHEPALPYGCQYETVNTAAWQTATRIEERNVLMGLYSLTGGAVGVWLLDDNWGQGDPCWDLWYGVTCNEHGYVIELDLKDNRLEGRLPSDLGRLTQLLRLDVSSTADQFQNHPNLYRNTLQGDIPSLRDCVNIEEIEVSGNSFESFPSDLYLNARTLKTLSASFNRIRSFPQQLRRFTNLHTLTLDHNIIDETMPADFGFLTNLRFVQLQYNSMNGEMPPDIVGMNRVRVLDVSHNPYLTGELPEEVIVTWDQVDYISMLNTTMNGYIAALCLDVPFCWRFMYDTHPDLTWATSADIPDIVTQVLELATTAASA